MDTSFGDRNSTHYWELGLNACKGEARQDGAGAACLCAEKRGHWEFSSKPELPGEFPTPQSWSDLSLDMF